MHAAVEAGALGASLSGSGPTLFALCPDRATAGRAVAAMAEALAAEGLDADRYTSRVGVAGARVS